MEEGWGRGLEGSTRCLSKGGTWILLNIIVFSNKMILAACRMCVTYQPSKWPNSLWVSRSLVGSSAQAVSGRPWVQFLLGAQNFTLSHACVIVEKHIVIKSLFHYKFNEEDLFL